MAGISENSIPIKVRNICVTVYQDKYEGPELLEYVCSTFKVRAAIFSKEKCPTTQRIHFQGYIEFYGQIRNNTIHKKLFNCHMEVRRGTAQQAWSYCEKPATHVEGPWTFGQPTEDGQRTDLTAAYAYVKANGMSAFIENEQFTSTFIRYGKGIQNLYYLRTRHKRREPPHITLYCGPAGAGKSRVPWDDEPRLVSIPGNLKWWSNYVDEEAVLFDDFDGAASQVPLKHLLTAMDRYPISLENKFGHVNGQYTRLYITTNLHPKRWYDWTRREDQYDALIRRIHDVYAYDKDNKCMKLCTEQEKEAFFNE